jgi:hypothetical protein
MAATLIFGHQSTSLPSLQEDALFLSAVPDPTFSGQVSMLPLGTLLETCRPQLTPITGICDSTKENDIF